MARACVSRLFADAISDVYFVELCVLSHVCANRDEIFELGVGQIFVCDFEEDAFLGLKDLLR